MRSECLNLRAANLLFEAQGKKIRYAKAKGIKEVSTLTHGFKLSLPFFEQITDAGIDWITISIDGIGDTYERIRAPIRFEELQPIGD